MQLMTPTFSVELEALRRADDEDWARVRVNVQAGGFTGAFDALQEWSSPEVEAAWDTEILKRIGEYERGEATLSPAADVFAEARRLKKSST
jgi:Putative addiction module component